jgi:hypothetical protein
MELELEENKWTNIVYTYNQDLFVQIKINKFEMIFVFLLNLLFNIYEPEKAMSAILLIKSNC